MKQSKATGGVRMAKLIEKGIPFKGGLWLDTYNQGYSTIAGTVTTRIDAGSCWFVTQVKEND